jgi:hypothetical protein
LDEKHECAFCVTEDLRIETKGHEMLNSLRERVAMIIHKETTQIPGKEPHECDYTAADAVIEEIDREVGRAVNCKVCGRRKKPIGRSAPIVMANSLCDHGCEGYYLEPKVGSLWPGEQRMEFGY